MAPNGDKKAFAVTGKSDRRLLEQTQLGNKGEHGPFCKSKTRGKGQLARVMIQKTEARRDKGGQASKGGEKGERGKNSKERAKSEHGQRSPGMKAAEGPRFRVTCAARRPCPSQEYKQHPRCYTGCNSSLESTLSGPPCHFLDALARGLGMRRAEGGMQRKGRHREVRGNVGGDGQCGR